MTNPPVTVHREDTTIGVVRTGTRLSWGAVFAGLVIATALQLLFAVLGGAIGLDAWDTDAGRGLGIGAAVWAAISILLSLYIGGTITGRLAGILARRDGVLHGMVLWAVSTLLTVWLIASGVGALAGATFSVFGKVAGAAAGAVTSGAASAIGSADIDLGNLRGEIEQVLRQTDDPALSPESLRVRAQRAGDTAAQSRASNSDVAGEIADMVRNTAGEVDREAVVNVIVARTGRSRAEAERMADRVIEARRTLGRQADTLRSEVGERAEQASEATSKALWFALLGMVLSLAAAVGGAATTARD